MLPEIATGRIAAAVCDIFIPQLVYRAPKPGPAGGGAGVYALFWWPDQGEPLVLSVRPRAEDFLFDVHLYPGLWDAERLALGKLAAGARLDRPGRELADQVEAWLFGPPAPDRRSARAWRAQVMQAAGIQDHEIPGEPARSFVVSSLATAARLAELVGVNARQVGVWYQRGQLPDAEPIFGTEHERVPARIWWLPRLLSLIPRLRKRVRAHRGRRQAAPDRLQTLRSWAREGRTLRVRDAAHAVGLSEEYIRAQIRNGRLHAERDSEGYLIDASQLLAWYETRTTSRSP